MDRTERFYKIDQLLNARTVVSTADLLAELGISLATLKRDLFYMQNHLHAPIVFDRFEQGYRFDKSNGIGPKYELPGLWFNATEIHALMVTKKLLEEIEPGLLEPHVRPLIKRLEKILDSTDHSAEEVDQRIFVFHPARRPVNAKVFGICATGVLSRKQLRILHKSRYTGDMDDRLVSPQRLTFYKNTWYLDVWCHVRDAVRSFSVDALQNVMLLDESAKEIPSVSLTEILGSGYGVYGGKDVTVAKLRFSPYQANWIVSERWHSNQKGYFEEDGHYILELPYADDPELIMDIMRYGANVEVLEPAELRSKVGERLKAAAAMYG